MNQHVVDNSNKYRIKSVNGVFLLTVIFALLGQEINVFVSKFTNSNLLILFISQIILVLPSVIYIIINRIKIADAIRFKKMRIDSILLVILFSYLISPLMSFINAISMLFVRNSTTSFIGGIVNDNGYILSLFMVAIIPAIFEETVYRGVLYNEYRKVSPLKGIVLSAFLFGIMHGNFNQFAYAFAMGVVFALVIEATDSILSTMIIHFFINGTSITILYILPKLIDLLTKMMESTGDTSSIDVEKYIAEIEGNMGQILTFSDIMKNLFLPMVIATILATVIFIVLAKNRGRWDYIKGIFIKNKKGKSIEEKNIEAEVIEYKSKESLMSVSIIIGILICISIMILNELL